MLVVDSFFSSVSSTMEASISRSAAIRGASSNTRTLDISNATYTSGRTARMSSTSLSNTVAKSTASNPAMRNTRSVSGCIGLEGPFNLRTKASLFTPTMSAPSLFASQRYSRCPLCKRSKHPLVKTSLLPVRRETWRMNSHLSRSSPGEMILS